MSDEVMVGREDAFWLLAATKEFIDMTNPPDSMPSVRLERITNEVNNQPRREGRPESDPLRFDIYVVRIEFVDRSPIAVRRTMDEAIEIARVYNMAKGDYTAVVFGYRFDSVDGTHVPLPS